MSYWFDAFVLLSIALLYFFFYRISSESRASFEDPEKSALVPPNTFLYPAKVIRQAGLIPQQIVLWYWMAKIGFVLLLVLLFLELGLVNMPVWGWLLSLLFAFYLLDLIFLNMRRKRRLRIQNSISYFMDLIVAFLQSGMILPQAIRNAEHHGLPRTNPLAKEIRIIAQEIEAGRESHEAFYALAERTGVADLHGLAAVLKVGFQVGSPVSDSLGGQADILRTKHWEQDGERLQRKSLAMLLPLLLVSVPVFLMLVFFPAIVQLQEVFQVLSNVF